MALLAALAVCLPAAAISALPASGAEPVPTRVDSFRACIAGGGTTDLLLLIDESSSLRGSDPDNARVTSAAYLIEQLTKSANASKAKVNVAISAFANSYNVVEGWTALSSATLPQLQGSIGSLKDRVNGMETDYWTALDGARKSLAAQSASRPNGQSCQAVVWFTDGGISYTVRQNDADKAAFGSEKPFAPGIQISNEAAAEQVRQAAMGDICRSGGVADQLRSSGIALFGIGLQGGSGDPSDFSFLQSVVTAKSAAQGPDCGTLTVPVPGEFHLATDIDSLLLAFDGISSPGSRPIAQETGICQVSRCLDQAHRFVLDQSTPSVRVLATADGTGLQASVMSPSGRIIELPRAALGVESTVTSDANVLKYSWISEKTLT
ncbi:MAG: VWA domain-containing protein, partial [Actinomycetota bacterium]|nr:VWA domain-containing protein [Actinomycetota bacterium]